MSGFVTICEVGPRDGLQIARTRMTTDDRIAWIEQVLAPNLRGVQNAYNAGAHKISIPVSVSDGHSMANVNRMPAQRPEPPGRHSRNLEF